MRVWLIGSGHLWPLQKTLAGLVPGWLLCTPAQQRAADPTFSILTQGEGTVDGGTEEGSSQLDGMRNRSLVLMLATPLGAYVQAGSRAKSVSDPATSEQRASAQSVAISSELAQLQDFLEKGSSVAARMLQSRILWLMGEAALREAISTDDYERAAGCFASSMRSLGRRPVQRQLICAVAAAGWCRAGRRRPRRTVLHTVGLRRPANGIVLGEASRCCGRRSSDAKHPHRLTTGLCGAGALDRARRSSHPRPDAKSGNRERVRTTSVLMRVALGLSVPALRGG